MHITQPQTVVQNISIRGAAQLINYDSIVGLIFIFVAFVNLAEILISKKKQLSNYTNNVFLRTTNLCLQRSQTKSRNGTDIDDRAELPEVTC